MEKEIEISVLMLAYNHERYIGQAIDSILSQNINVPYEIIIHDDVSTDGTRQILYEYKKKYPDIIKLLIRKEKAKSVTYAVCQIFKAARGKYIAWCDGDDYWIDNNKLQIQYDFMENHKNYVSVAHDKIIVDEDGKEIFDKKDKLTYQWRGDYSLENYWYSGRLPGQSSTMFSRNVYKEENLSWICKAHHMMADKSTILVSLLHGNIYRMDGKMSARRLIRKKDGESWNSIVLHLDADYEQMRMITYQLFWFERRTKNYSMVSNKWKSMMSRSVKSVMKGRSNVTIRKKIILCFRILLGVVNNFIMCNISK